MEDVEALDAMAIPDAAKQVGIDSVMHLLTAV